VFNKFKWPILADVIVMLH